MHIKGGYIIQPRVINESALMKHPPIDREIWFYLIRMVNHADKGMYKRGSGFFSYSNIQKDLEWFIGFRRCEYSKPQISKAMQRLSDKGMITTTKATRGIIITICKYDYYQNPKNYEGNAKKSSHESNDERAMKATVKATMKATDESAIRAYESDSKSHSKNNESNGEGNDERATKETMKGYTKNKNDKNVNNDKNDKNIDSVLDVRKQKFALTLEPFLENFGRDVLNEFYAYWTEPNTSNTKFRQELEKTWDTKRRLDRWVKNDFSKKEKSSGQKEKPSKLETNINAFQKALSKYQ